MRLRKAQKTAEKPAPPTVPDVRPPESVLYSRYIRARPRDPEPAGGSRAATAAMVAMAARTGLDDAVRNRLLLALEDCAPSITGGAYDPDGHPTNEGVAAMVSVVAERLSRFLGELSLATRDRQALDALVQVIRFEPDPRVLDVVGAWLDAYARIPSLRWLEEAETEFAARIDHVLADTSYARRGRDIVLRRDAGSAPVVEQPLRAFMANNPRFAAVDTKLAEAFAELDAGNGADAITDAATALQLLLKELGHTGPALGDQITSARKGGLFTGVDHQLGEALLALAKWIASVRNQRGDAHPGPDPDLADAQLLVRMVALLVMRLGR